MGLSANKPKSHYVSKREKLCRFMELRGITNWFEGKLAVYYQPVASVPDAPSFVELIELDVKKEELLELLINICGGYWENESGLDEALATLESPVGKKLADRSGELSCKLNGAFDQYMKAKLDEKARAFKRTTMQ